MKNRDKRLGEMHRTSVCCGITLSSDYNYIWSHLKRRTEKIFENNGLKFSNFVENYRHTCSKSLAKAKYKKDKLKQY